MKRWYYLVSFQALLEPVLFETNAERPFFKRVFDFIKTSS
jgi:hypothetical protein